MLIKNGITANFGYRIGDRAYWGKNDAISAAYT